MDTMFDNNHTVILPENNNMNFDVTNHSGPLSVEALKLMMNKRKLESTTVVNQEQTSEKNGNDGAKRICTMNGHQYEQRA